MPGSWFGQAAATPANRLLSASLIFVCGIALASYAPAELAKRELLWLGAMSAAAVLLAWLWPKPKCRYALAALFLLATAAWRYSLTFPVASDQALWMHNGNKVGLVGRVAAEPIVSQKDQRLEIEAEELIDPEKKAVAGRLLAVTVLNPEFAYGDRVRLSCLIQAPQPVETFAYDRYLAKEGIYSVCYRPVIAAIGQADLSWTQRVTAGILAIKDSARKQLERSLPEPQAGLVKGMVLGDQRGIGKEVQDDFSRSGLSHVVAISGMNMTILAAMFVELFLLFGLSRRPAVVGAGLALWLYTALIGWPPSAVRAVILSSLFLLAILAGRLNDLPRALALAAAGMLLVSPRLLRDDLGFALSFLAFLGVAYFVPVFDRIPWWPKSVLPQIRELIWLTLAAQVLVWPLLAVSFGQVSLIAPLANVLVVWTLPLIMLIALVALPLAAIWPLAGKGLLLLPGWLAGFAAAVAHLMSKPAWAAVTVGRLSVVCLVAYYATVMWLYLWWNKREGSEASSSL